MLTWIWQKAHSSSRYFIRARCVGPLAEYNSPLTGQVSYPAWQIGEAHLLG